MKEIPKFLKLKVYKNSKTGQRTIILPKKKIGNDDPKEVKVRW